MTVVHNMSDFVFPERTKAKPTITPDNTLYSSSINQAFMLTNHNQSSSFSSNSGLPSNSDYSTSPNESGFIGTNYMSHLQSGLPSSHTSSNHSESYYSQKAATYSTTSVHYRPIVSTAIDDVNSMFVEDRTCIQKSTLAQPFMPIQQLGGHDTKKRNSSTYTNESVETLEVTNTSTHDLLSMALRV